MFFFLPRRISCIPLGNFATQFTPFENIAFILLYTHHSNCSFYLLWAHSWSWSCENECTFIYWKHHLSLSSKKFSVYLWNVFTDLNMYSGKCKFIPFHYTNMNTCTSVFIYKKETMKYCKVIPSHLSLWFKC